MASVGEAKKISKRTVIVVPDDTTGKVSEKIGNATVSYDAKIEQQDIPNETNEDADDSSEDVNFQDIFESQDQPFTPIPKSSLEIMFDRIGEIVNQHEMLYASITRTPDSFTDRFNVPCNTQMNLGVVQFSTNDLFNFIPNLQRLAGNTGGHFNVLVYKQNQQPLMYFRHMINGRVDGDGVHVGTSLYVPNPQPTNEAQQQNTNPQADIITIMREMNDRADARMQKILEGMKSQQSDLEKQIMQKALDNILNPPAPVETKKFSMEETMTNIMQSGVVMASFGDAFAKMLNREPPPVAEATWLDQVKEITNIPVVQNIIERVTDVAEAAAVNKMQLPAAPNPTNEDNENDNTMKELLTTIIDELESDRPLDANNPVIIDLRENYPSESQMLQGFCSSLPFDATVSTLGNMMAKVSPHPYTPFLDIERTKTEHRYIWNERGEKMIVRLEEFYNYVRVADFG